MYGLKTSRKVFHCTKPLRGGLRESAAARIFVGFCLSRTVVDFSFHLRYDVEDSGMGNFIVKNARKEKSTIIYRFPALFHQAFRNIWFLYHSFAPTA